MRLHCACVLALAASGCSSSPSSSSDEIVVASVKRCTEALPPAALDDIAVDGDRAAFLAKHPLAQVLPGVGSPISAPRVVSVFFGTDPTQATVEALLDSYGCTPAWRDAVGEYGVGDLLRKRSVVLEKTPDLDPTIPTAFGTWIATEIAAGTFGDVADGDLLLFLLPPDFTTFPGECLYDGGAHFEVATDDGRHVPYAYALSCAPTSGTAEELLLRTLTVTHELIEATTNPLPATAPSWHALSRGIRATTMPPSPVIDELADYCAGGSAQTPDYPFATARAYSNRRARAGLDPCGATAAPIPILAVTQNGADVDSLDLEPGKAHVTIEMLTGDPTGPYDVFPSLDVFTGTSVQPSYGLTESPLLVESDAPAPLDLELPAQAPCQLAESPGFAATFAFCTQSGLGCLAVHLAVSGIPACLATSRDKFDGPTRRR